MPKKSEIRIATLTIHRAGDMTEDGRVELATWLREQAYSLENEGNEYAKRFTARYDIRPIVGGRKWFK